MDLKYSKKDFYTKKAKEENYPARSVYKLKEINEKYRIFKYGDKVLDLGCAPGSWMLYIARNVGDRGRVVGLDIDNIKINLPKNAEFIKGDIMKIKIDGMFDVIVSDLAPSTSGIGFADVEGSLLLCERSFEITKEVLKSGGNFLCKMFEGEGTDEFFKKAKQYFKFIKIFRPKATRKGSREIYIVAMGFKNYEKSQRL
jgi:23S rRNA (uridine2552-2'-O)-methyltransferase